MDPNTNGEQPAFGDSTTHAHQHGLTKREHFAAMAMQGILAQPKTLVQLGWECKTLAQSSIDIADALLRALAAGGEG